MALAQRAGLGELAGEHVRIAVASRGQVARLTARGQRAQADYQWLLGAVEQPWRDQFGAEHIDGLASALRGLFADGGG